MGYIRFAWTALAAVVMFILSLPLLLVAWIGSFINPKISEGITMWVIKVSFSVVVFLSGTRIHLSGLENVPKDQAVLYVANHRSFYDVLCTYRLFPGSTLFIAKKQFEKVPVFSWWIKMVHGLFLDRDDIKQGLQVILKAIEYCKSGISVCIYPEGTRNKTQEDILPFHEGSFKVAQKTGCPIIPITMYNMSAVFEDHFPAIERQDVFVHFGEPIIISELPEENKKHVGAYTREIMLKKYQELKKQHEELNAK